MPSGQASCSYAFATAGSQPVTATYNGTDTTSSSASTVVPQAVVDQTGKTVAAIGGFLAARNNQILSNGPDDGRQIDRLLEVAGNAPGGNSGSGFAADGQTNKATGLSSPAVASRLGSGPDTSDLPRLGTGGRGSSAIRTDTSLAGLVMGHSD